VDTLLTTENLTLDHFRYKPTESGKFQFHILAEDESGNVSQSKQNITRSTSAIVTGNQKPELQLETNYDKGYVELSWSKIPNASTYLIYRKQADDTFRLYSTIEGDQSSFIDKKCTVGIHYTYRVVGKLKNGQNSAFSNVAEIKY
jgi:hypothetical protein